MRRISIEQKASLPEGNVKTQRYGLQGFGVFVGNVHSLNLGQRFAPHLSNEKEKGSLVA